MEGLGVCQVNVIVSLANLQLNRVSFLIAHVQDSCWKYCMTWCFIAKLRNPNFTFMNWIPPHSNNRKMWTKTNKTFAQSATSHDIDLTF